MYIKDDGLDKKKEDDIMAALAEYLGTNKDKVYSFATSNTKYNQTGRPVISKDDEWVNETEWDELFQILASKTQKG